MRASLLLGAFLSLAASASADEVLSAFEALKLLPRGQVKNVARIEAREGVPGPERWHILVHDREAESGVREYVVAGGEIVASRGLSQFAEILTAGDVIAAELMKIDSDRVVKLLEQYASANARAISTVNYELRKDGAEAVPLWRVTGLDVTGKEVGILVVTASQGTVISHAGFELEPAPAQDNEELSQLHTNRSVSSAEPVLEEESLPHSRRRQKTSERRPGLLRRAGGSLQKFFTGRNSISR